MAKPITIHTLASIMGRCEPRGECQIWTGMINNGVPKIYDGGRMVAVRYVVARLAKRISAKDVPEGIRFSPSCGNGLCVARGHVMIEQDAEFYRRLAAISNTGERNTARVAKITATRRARSIKLGADRVAEIKTRTESARTYAARFGVDKGMIYKIWSGLTWR